MLLRAAVTVLACSGIGACTRTLDRPEEIAGVYVLNASTSRDVLELQPDGRYVRTYSVPGQPAVVDTGTWEMSQASDGPRVVVSNYVSRWRGQAFPDIPRGPGYWSTYARRTAGGTVTLNVNEDLGLAYVRQ